MDTTTSAIKLKSHIDKALKTFKQNKEYCVKNRDTHDDRVAGLRKKVDKSLQQSLKNVYESFDQMEALRLDISVSSMQLDPFQFVQGMTFVGDLGATSQSREA